MRVLILGLGQYPKGSGVAAALFFARRGDAVTVYDFYYTQAMDKNIATLKKFKNVRFVMGEHRLHEIAEAELIVKHQRLRETEPEVVEARRLKKTMETELSLILKWAPCPVIGVTGTRGKSTTTALLHAMLVRGTTTKVWLGGNILVSPLTYLHRIKKTHLMVLELSSFQLEGLADAKVSPQVAVWTNLLRDHLNAYPSMKEYGLAKAQIFLHQRPEDRVFLPADTAFDVWAKRAKGHVYRFAKAKSPEVALVRATRLKLLGEHNRRNAEIATAVALALGVKQSAIVHALKTFPGLPSRLEVLGTMRGITVINDTAATTPDATQAALAAVQGKTGVTHLIFGGADKELAFEEVAKRLRTKRIRVILLPGTAQEKILNAFAKVGVTYTLVASMREAVDAAFREAKRGDCVLLSPGCASFGLFKNEYDRGAKFKAAIKRLAR